MDSVASAWLSIIEWLPNAWTLLNAAATSAVGGAFVAVMGTYIAQRQLIRYQRAREDERQAWDELLRPLFFAVRDVKWDAFPPGIDRATRFATRWRNASEANDRFREVSVHRLAPLIRRELDMVSHWLYSEAYMSSHWTQTISAFGLAGGAFFSFLVLDTSQKSATFSKRDAWTSLAASGLGSPSDEVIEQVMSATRDDELWEKARSAAEQHLELARAADQEQAQVVDQLRDAIEYGGPREARSFWKRGD